MNSNPTSTQVAILGVPFRGGQPKAGVDLAPAALRRAGMEDKIKELGYDVRDLGDVVCENREEQIDSQAKAKNSRWVGDTTKQSAEVIVKELATQQDAFMLSLGGDHSIAIGTISGLLDTHASPEQNGADLCVVWVDAHADINTPAGSISGNIHGMPVSFLMRDSSLIEAWTIPGFEWMDPSTSSTRNLRLDPRKLVYIGLRDVDEDEEAILRRFNIKNYRIPEVREKGISKVMEEIIEYLNLGSDSTSKDRLHLSFDIDGVDPGPCPATGTAVEDGLTVDEGHAICTALGRTGRLVSMDMVEINPALSDEAGARSTVDAGLSLILSALAARPQTPRRRIDP